MFRFGAQKRMNGEDVYGNPISVSSPRPYGGHFPIKRALTYPKVPTQDDRSKTYQQQLRNTFPSSSQAITPLFDSTICRPVDQVLNSSQHPFINHADSYNRVSQRRNEFGQEFNYLSRDAVRPIRGTHGNTETYMDQMTYAQLASQDQVENEQYFCDSLPSNPNQYHQPSNNLAWQQNTSTFYEDNERSNLLEGNDYKPDKKYSETRASTSRHQYSQQQSIELIVTNLDLNIAPGQMRRTLLNLFRNHAHVLHAALFKQSDGSVAASVKVGSQADAQVAISQLHRRRIGHKRISINYAAAASGGVNREQLKSQVISLLLDVPGSKLPVFKFRRLFETRYLTTISISELYRLQDVCSVLDDPSGRMVVLNTENTSTTPSPDSSLFDMLHCPKHDAVFGKSNIGWAEKEIPELPNIRIGLELFTGKLHVLLQNHKGTLPLQSFQDCYQAVLHEPLPVDDTGVPLEHLVTCVTGVELRQGPAKQIIWSTSSTSKDITEEGSNFSVASDRQSSAPLVTHLALFSRELVDLLRTTPNCRLSFTRFIPAYHHHFGRQCRVADYGFTRLVDLFESMPHVVQILGEGDKRMITLSHRSQIRRFTGDLLRILKSSTLRQIALSDFSAAAEQSLGKPWDPVHYGVCELEDLLASVPEHIVVVKNLPDNNTIIALPKRDQTTEEMHRTQLFSMQVIELLRHERHCSMAFNKFVPAYHHYFNQQCRVADYGFTKLIELFEVLPDVVQIVDQPGKERIVRLTEKEALRILSNQIIQIIRNNSIESYEIEIENLPDLYVKDFGYKLQPEEYQCQNLIELLQKLGGSIVVRNKRVALVEWSSYESLGLRVWRVLLESVDFRLTPNQLLLSYQIVYNENYELSQLKQISYIVQVTNRGNEWYISLTPRYRFAARAYTILYENCYGTTYLELFEHLYKERYGAYDFENGDGLNIQMMIASVSNILVLSGGGKDYQTISLNPQLESIGIALPDWIHKSDIKADKPQSTQTALSSLEATVKECLWPTSSTGYSNTSQGYSPPKPDTPPSKQAATWNELWGSPMRAGSDLTIPMPISEFSLTQLMSPSAFNLPTIPNTFKEGTVLLTSPPANVVPLPNLDDSDNTDTGSCDSKTESFQISRPNSPKYAALDQSEFLSNIF